MKSIKFTSSHGQQHVDVPAAGISFENGEEKAVTDEQADLLLRNSDFSEVKPAAAPAIKPPSAEQE